MGTPLLTVDRKEGGTYVCTPSDSLLYTNSRRYWDAFQQLLSEASLTSLVLDMSRVRSLDSAGSTLLLMLRDQCRRRNITIQVIHPRAEVRSFLQFSGFWREPKLHVPPRRQRPPFMERVGLLTLELLHDLKNLIQFIGNVTVAAFPCCVQPRRFRPKEILYYIQLAGAEAIPIVFLVSYLMGLIMAFQAAVQLRQFGANIFVADLVSLALTRELGPLMTAIILAGRSAAAFAAEIGTMKVNEEVDALMVMGFNVTEFLILPKVLALAVSGPLLTVMANAAGIVGGITVGITALDLTPMSFLVEVGQILTVRDVAGGLLKSLAFSVVVALVGCFRGLQAENTADSVGRMTTSAVVTSIFLILVTDAIFTVIYQVFSW